MSIETDHSREIIIALRRISQAIDTYSRQLWQDNGLTAPQLGTLREIEHGNATPGELAARLHVSPATVAGILKRLESRELITRIRDPNDRRSFHVQITPQGALLCSQAPSLLRDRFHRELEQIDVWERTQMLAMLQRVAAMMGADQGDDEPFLFNNSLVPNEESTDATTASGEDDEVA